MRRLEVVLLLVVAPIAARAQTVASGFGSAWAEIHARVRPSIVRVEAGLAHGSGWLAAAGSELVVVTNDHVVGNDSLPVLEFDDSVRVVGRVLIQDPQRDLAVVRVPQQAVEGRLALPLGPTPRTGTPVAAFGSPLSQRVTMATGAIAATYETGMALDLQVHPGNSGGAIVDTSGIVVGIVAFMDRSEYGYGIGGAVGTDALVPLLRSAEIVLRAQPPVALQRRPSFPRGTFPLNELRLFGDTADAGAYSKFEGLEAGPFHVAITTPTSQHVGTNADAVSLLSARRKREIAAGVPVDRRATVNVTPREWERYVGDERTPVITFTVTPKVGESFWNGLARGLNASLTGVQSAAILNAKGDVRGLRIFRNDTLVIPIRAGHGPQIMQISNTWVFLEDVADMGYLVLDPMTFAPDASGNYPRIRLEVDDLKNLGRIGRLDVPPSVVVRAWHDFGPYFRSQRISIPQPRDCPTFPGRRCPPPVDPGAPPARPM